MIVLFAWQVPSGSLLSPRNGVMTAVPWEDEPHVRMQNRSPPTARLCRADVSTSGGMILTLINMVGVFRKGLVEIKNFKVLSKKARGQCSSNWFTEPRDLLSQVCILGVVTGKHVQASCLPLPYLLGWSCIRENVSCRRAHYSSGCHLKDCYGTHWSDR